MEKIKDFALIVSEAQRGELVFPTSVNAALSLQLTVANPDCHDEDVIRKVLAEPVLAARAVALANSAVFRSNGAALVTSVRAAVQRLGYRNLYTLAAAMVVRQFGSRIRDPQLRAKAEQLWKYSAHVAALSYLIAKRITQVDADTALFAGIMHEVGGFYLLSRADTMPGLLEEPEDWMGAALEIVARELMKKLMVPEPVSAAIVALRGGAVSFPPAGLRDTLLLAKHLCPVLSPMPHSDDHVLLRTAALAQYLADYPAISALLQEAAGDADAMSAALLV
ncbi:HDOD domain-containing protein [Massilia sp. MB5]|uniref:HDOD domain-containing protein n=1 Tax=unclassified Massilia TaxID=2609279 RepID=UPI00067D972D|nr:MULTISPECIES: HDOD domain-containing protein [unclassified Massilia]AKU24375.1 histidine kinase [Massilia sp. NR 4-1]UMR30624.1 HDOD domain-containing protein [Massilia sp. MB5]